MANFIRRQFKGSVSYTDALLADITNASASITLKDGTTFPDGSVGPFIVTIDAGGALEEKVLCSARSGASLTVAGSGRGYDGTVAVAHSANATCLHTVSAQDLDEANQAAVQTVGKVTTAGDLLYGTGANALARLGIGSVNQALMGGASAPAWSGAPVFSGEVAATDFKASGLTGAVAASRHVGGTVSGAPASGTFLVGDFVVDQTGKVWVCTVAGTPGTWAQVGGATTLSTDSGVLAADTNCTISWATVLTTASLATGTWLVVFNAFAESGTVAGAIDVKVIAGTATATFAGVTTGSPIVIGGTTAAWGNCTLTCLVTVTVAGTLVFQTIAGSVTGNPRLLAESWQTNIHGGTGYSAVKVA